MIPTRILAATLLASAFALWADVAPTFKVLGFSTSKDDAGHISYEHEANQWLPKMGKLYGFNYDSTKVWADCNTAKLSQYQVVIFMDERPEDAGQRTAFQKYIEAGGGFIGCHGSAFELTGSQQPTNWSWYHDTFFGSGEYVSNTWRPTSAFLKLEDSSTALTKGLPSLFKSSPNEWYRWKVDLKTKPDIKILLSIDPSSFPLGTGPKQEEIWHSGYYPVAWTNVKYHMLYVNMGHNDLNSPENNGKDSQTFANDIQNKLFLNALLNFGGANTTAIGNTASSSLAKTSAGKAGAGFHKQGAGMKVSKTGAGTAEYDLPGRQILPAHQAQ